jgi:hypothetical protein
MEYLEEGSSSNVTRWIKPQKRTQVELNKSNKNFSYKQQMKNKTLQRTKDFLNFKSSQNSNTQIKSTK